MPDLNDDVARCVADVKHIGHYFMKLGEQLLSCSAKRPMGVAWDTSTPPHGTPPGRG
jgi:hypothetical protein